MQKNHLWKLGTINVRTGREDQKLERIVHEINKANLSICALQEVRRLSQGSATIPKQINDATNQYEVYWSGYARKRIHGVGLVVKVDPNIEVNSIIYVNSRIIVADITLYGCKLKVICCYAPTEEDTLSAKDTFYNKIKSLINKTEKDRKVICLGDFNATTSASWSNTSLRENSIVENLEFNDNGKRFHTFFDNCHLSVLNTWFTHKRCRRVTWYSPDGVTQKVYDFILTCSWLRQYVLNCRVYRSYDFDSDHRLVIATMNTPCTKFARFRRRDRKTNPKKLNLKMLENERIRDQFTHTAVENLNTMNFENQNNQSLHNHLVTSINSAAESTIPKITKERITQPWHNDEKLIDLYRQKDELMAQNPDLIAIKKLRKKIRHRACFLKNEYFRLEAEKINNLAINRNLQKLFQRAKDQTTTLKPILASCPTQSLLMHFESHFNPPKPGSSPKELSDDHLPLFINDLRQISRSVDIINEPPDINEIQEHLKKLKSNKAFNDIDATLLKRLEHPVMLQVIHRMSANLWHDLDVPTPWGNSRLQAIWKKKGSKKDPTKYRGISIGSTVCKLLVNLILERLRPWYELQLSDEQNGFRKDRGTTEGIYTIKRIQQITDRKKQPLFLLFVDLSSAFDHVPRDWLFESIRLRFDRNQSSPLFDILEKLYSNTTLTYDDANRTFETTSGVRQGGPESPFLFNLFIDFVMRIFMERSDGINFFKHKYRINLKSLTRSQRYEMRTKKTATDATAQLPWIGYADDLVLFLLDIESLKVATELLNEIFESFGLKINKLKTETMILNHHVIGNDYPTSIISLGDTPLKNVADFTYLGSNINNEEPSTGDGEINNRIQIATSKFNEMSNLLQNHRINIHTRVKFLDSYVRSRLTYACQNWNLSSNQFERLNTTYRSFLRRMVRNGQKYVNEAGNDYRMFISNARLHLICGTNDLDCFVRRQQKNYLSHVVRMNCERSIKQLTFNNDTYKKRGRPIKTLLDQVTDELSISIDEFCTLALKGKD